MGWPPHARILALATLLAMLACTSFARAAEEPYGAHVSRELMVEITTRSSVIRSGPGEDFAIVAFQEEGAKFPVLAKKDDWYNVRVSATQTGWVHKSLVREFHDLSHLEFRPNPKMFSRVGSFALTGFGGAYSFDRKSNALLLGGRLAYYLFEYVDVEGTVGWSHIVRPAEIVESLFDLELAEEDFHLLYYAMNVNLQLLPGRQMVPYLTFGAGSTIMQGETESGINYGGGATMYVRKRVAVRWEFRTYHFASGAENARRDNKNLEFSLGTAVLF
jgi:outer membrane beta-barrel protein